MFALSRACTPMRCFNLIKSTRYPRRHNEGRRNRALTSLSTRDGDKNRSRTLIAKLSLLHLAINRCSTRNRD